MNSRYVSYAERVEDDKLEKIENELSYNVKLDFNNTSLLFAARKVIRSLLYVEAADFLHNDDRINENRLAFNFHQIQFSLDLHRKIVTKILSDSFNYSETILEINELDSDVKEEFTKILEEKLIVGPIFFGLCREFKKSETHTKCLNIAKHYFNKQNFTNLSKMIRDIDSELKDVDTFLYATCVESFESCLYQEDDSLPLLPDFPGVSKLNFQNKGLLQVVAASGVGKTLFMCTLASAYARINVKVLFISVEMRYRDIVRALISTTMKYDYTKKIQNQKEVSDHIASEFREKYSNFISVIACNDYDKAIKAIKSDAYRDHRVVFIDYLQRFQTKSSKSSDKFEIEEERIRTLSEISNTNDKFIVNAMQITKDKKKDTYGDLSMGDLGGSKAMSEAADYILYLQQIETRPSHLYLKSLKVRFLTDSVRNHSDFSILLKKNGLILEEEILKEII